MEEKIKVTFFKRSEMKYISHLDLVRLFQRAARRAGLPVTVTKGFTPRLKISITRALKLGAESDSEDAVFSMSKPLPPETFTRAINGKLPPDVQIIKA